MFSSTEVLHDQGLIEREYVLDGVPGILWTPSTTSTTEPTGQLPLVLLGHPGGLDQMRSRLRDRARHAAALGFATTATELPGAGRRPALADVDRARSELREALGRGDRPGDDVVDRLVLPLVEAAVPEWRAVLDHLLARPELGGPIAVSGGVTAIAVRLAVVEPRLAAVGLFAGSYLPLSILEEARRITLPVHMLLQWDDHGNDRQRSLELFDAIGSAEKTLQANLGGHTGIPPHAAHDHGRFLERHLT